MLWHRLKLQCGAHAPQMPPGFFPKQAPNDPEGWVIRWLLVTPPSVRTHTFITRRTISASKTAQVTHWGDTTSQHPARRRVNAHVETKRVDVVPLSDRHDRSTPKLSLLADK
eukprot:5569755-Pyramimonas_sp.AAC.1